MSSSGSLFRKRLLLAASLSITLSGCIAYAPSTTDWRKTPKIVLQVCVPAGSAHTAEIAYYGPTSRGVWTAKPIAQTEVGQDIYEASYGDATPLNAAFAVRLVSQDPTAPSRYFIYLLLAQTTSDWPLWRLPDTVESSFPAEVDKFKRFRAVEPDVLKEAPRIRVRTEMLSSYESTHRSRERYVHLPSCN